MQRRASPPLALILLIVALVYVFVETRYPTANQDDNLLMAKQFPEYVDGQLLSGGLHTLLFKHNGVSNEFRTYPLAKLFQYGLYLVFGHKMIGYYIVMAAMAVATALIASFVTLRETGSQSIAIAIAMAGLLGPFMLFQTFHHASYIVFPLLATVGYLALALSPSERRWRLASGLLCALVAMTGEIAVLVLVAVLGVFLMRSLLRRDYPAARAFMVHGVIVISAVFLQYVIYRYTVYNPSLETRFLDQGSLTLHSAQFALAGLFGTLATRVFSADLFRVMNAGVQLDLAVVVAIGGAALVALVGISRSSKEPSSASAKPALLVALMFVASGIVYVLIAARANVGNYPPRYLHASGLLLLAAACLAASCLPVILRKVFLSGVVTVCALAGVLTFGVKVPTIEAFNDRISEQVANMKSAGGSQVNVVPAPNRIFVNPYLLEPATTPYSAFWIIESYSLLYWGLPSRQNATAQPGDIVIRTEKHSEGYLPVVSVSLIPSGSSSPESQAPFRQ